MAYSFNGKLALVTGASQGIGRYIAKALSKCGAKVYAIGLNEELLGSLKTEMPTIETVAVDLSDWKATKAALQKIGDIDLLVNNAGVAHLAPLTDVTEEHIDKSFGVNVKAVINVSQYVAQNLLKRKSPGAIVSISSQASMAGLQDHAVYCATKGAVDAFTRAAALELGPHQIRVNSVNPTVIMTDMGRLGWSDHAKSKPMLEKIPLRRFGEVDEVTNVVLFLLSDQASLMTGSCVPVDGGYLAV